MNRPLASWLIVLGSYLLLACLFFYPFFQGKSLIYLDNLLHQAPAYFLFRQEILSGQIPLWNPYILAGMPLLADPSHGLLSPLTIVIFLFKDVLLGVTFQALFLVFLASLGAYILARALRLSLFPSFLAGLLFGFSGSVFEVVNDVNSLAGVAFIPWVLATFVSEVYRKKRYFSWKLALVVALQIISGHTQYSYYTILVVAFGYLYTIFQKGVVFDKKQIRKIGLSLGTLMLAFGLAAVQLIPTGELVVESQRTEAIADFQNTHLDLVSLPRLIFPKIYGSIIEGNSWGPGSQRERGLADLNGAIALSGLLLAGIGIKRFFHRKEIKFWAALGIFSLVLAFEYQTPLYGLFQYLLPGLAYFRSPERILIFYSLAVALLAATTLDGAFSKIWLKVRIERALLFGVIFGMILSLTILYFSPDLFGRAFAGAYTLIKGESLSTSSAYTSAKVEAISRLFAQSLMLFFWGLAGFWAFIKYLATKTKHFFYLGTLLVVVELFIVVRGTLLFAQPSSIQANPEVVEYLKIALGNDRYISTADTEAFTGIWVYFNHLATRPPFSQEQVTQKELQSWDLLREEMSMLPVDTNQLYGFRSAAGYVALLPRAYRNLTTPQKVNSLDFQSYNNPLLNDFGVKYLVTGVPGDMMVNSQEKERLAKVFSSGNIGIYENKLAKPRVEFLADTGRQSTGTIEIKEDRPNRVTIASYSQHSGQLVLRDLWYPGWKVKVDGKEKEIEPYQGIFRQVSLTLGKHLVIFYYAPDSLKWGSLISGLSLLTTVMIVLKESKSMPT